MLEQIKKNYIKERVSQVDSDFLAFEEDMISLEDQERISTLISLLDQNSQIKLDLPNPHNSIILYLCGLTNHFDLDKGRSNTIDGSPPDIDIDHDALDRDKAIQWVVDYWGRDNVANIITHGTFKPKSLARSYYRVTEGEQKDLTDILKKIPPPKYGREATLSEITEINPDITNEDRYSEFYRFASTLEDMVANFGIHAAGLVISDKHIREVLPTWKNSKAELITQFDMKEVENLGLIKFDFLSIDTLSIIKECLRLVKEYKGEEIDPYKIPDGDRRAYAMLHEGLLTGVFQMETSGMAKKLITSVKPTSIEELSDISALNRPGPLQAGLDKQYKTNKSNGYAPNDLPEQLATLLKSSYWTLIYQEQVMAICSDLAGFSQKEADDIRRAMGKKDVKVLTEYKKSFIEGAVSIGGLDESYADDLWDDLLGFADYCFNKAHSVSYSILTYISAYLKANYSVEFFSALMTVRSKTLQPKLWAQKAPEYIQEAKTLGVVINPPGVNGSGINFTVQENEVFFGLNAIRDVGKTAARSIVSSRGKTPFKDVYDFLARNNLRKVTIKTFQSLICAGAFDKLGYSRKNLMDESVNLYNYVRDVVEYEQRKIDSAAREVENAKATELIDKRNDLRKEIKTQKRLLKKISEEDRLKQEKLILDLEQQLEPLEELKLRRLPPLKLKEEPQKVKLERYSEVKLNLQEIIQQAHYIGCYVITHPAQLISNGCDRLESLWTGQRAHVCGVVNSIKVIRTKTGRKMAFVEIDDATAVADLTIFSKLWSKLEGEGIETGSLLKMDVKVESEEPSIKLIAENIKIYKEN